MMKEKTLFFSCVYDGCQPKLNLCILPEETNDPHKKQTQSLCFASLI